MDLIFIGGYTDKNNIYTKGTFAENMLKQLYIDKAFISFDNIDANKNISMQCMGFVKFKQLALNCSMKKYALGEHDKFKKENTFKICPISDLDELITDIGLNDEIYNEYVNDGLNITRA